MGTSMHLKQFLYKYMLVPVSSALYAYKWIKLVLSHSIALSTTEAGLCVCMYTFVLWVLDASSPARREGRGRSFRVVRPCLMVDCIIKARITHPNPNKTDLLQRYYSWQVQLFQRCWLIYHLYCTCRDHYWTMYDHREKWSFFAWPACDTVSLWNLSHWLPNTKST